MKIIIAGSRQYTTASYAEEIKKILSVHVKLGDTIISGGCPNSPDEIAIQYAIENHLNYEIYPADWKKYGRSAGPIRNIQMSLLADQLIAFWDNQSHGTKHMITQMEKLKKTVYKYTI